MSGKRYTNEFRIEAVEQLTGRGCSVPDVAQRLGIATHGLYAWKAKFEKPDVVRQTEGAGTASRSVETRLRSIACRVGAALRDKRLTSVHETLAPHSARDTLTVISIILRREIAQCSPIMRKTEAKRFNHRNLITI